MNDLSSPPSHRLARREGGLEFLRCFGEWGTADIFLQGAHLASWVPRGQAPVLWMSPLGRYEPGIPLRGGVPLSFPWFAVHPSEPLAPRHGFARTALWTLVELRESAQATTAVLRLGDSEATRASVWPHSFAAEYEITVGASLRLSLTIENTGDHDFSFEQALHSYYALGDAATASVRGLEARPYLDYLDGSTGLQGPELTPDRAVDRLYQDADHAAIDDRAIGRRVSISSQGSSSIIVWNPGEQGSLDTADLSDDAWTGMVCVETGNVRERAITLAAGASHRMVTTVTLGPL